MAISIRHLKRYRQIVGTLARYGFGDIVASSWVKKTIYLGRKFLPWKGAINVFSLSRWERIRMVLEELGPTFVKFGQIMSNRPDLVPHPLIVELKKLQSEVPPFSAREARRLVEVELRKPIAELFSDYTTTAMASASIAQVHRARLKDGNEVVIKIQRPDIKQIIETDIEIMFHLAALMERYAEKLNYFSPVAIVAEIERAIKRELDFNLEAAAIERFRINFQNNRTIHIPKVYHDYSTSKILTMEFIDGIKVGNLEGFNAAGLDLKLIAKRGANLILKQIFEHGFFHADPHPGNIMVLPGNIISLIDYGMMGTIAARDKEYLSSIFIGIVTQDSAKITRIILQLSGNPHMIDADSIEYEIQVLLQYYTCKPISSINIGNVLNQLINLIMSFRLKIPHNFFLLAKALITIEGVARTLDPDLDMMKLVEPFAVKLLNKQTKPDKLLKDLYLSAFDLSELLRHLPSDIKDIVTQTKEGKLKIGFEHIGLEPINKTLNIISKRLVTAVVLAALLLISALFIIARIPPLLQGISLIGIGGLLVSGIIGVWLLFSIHRH